MLLILEAMQKKAVVTMLASIWIRTVYRNEKLTKRKEVGKMYFAFLNIPQGEFPVFNSEIRNIPDVAHRQPEIIMFL